MKKIYLLILTINTFFFAQHKIENIAIIGNKTTDSSIILNALNHQIGDEISMDLIKQDKIKLLDLNLFSNVIIYPNQSTLYIIVQEKRNFIFIPLISKDDILGWSYGAGIRFKNINDKDQKINVGYMTGEISSYFLEYTKIFKDKKYIQIENRFSKANHSSIENDYIVTKNDISTKLTFKYNLRLHIQLQYNRLNYIDSILKDLTIREIKNTIYYNKINSFKYKNQKNIFELHYSLVIGNYNYTHNHNHIFNILNKYSIDLLSHKNSARFTVKKHLILNSSYDIPIYEKIYLNSEDYVRGYAINPLENNLSIENKMKWNNILLLSLQFEIPLFNKDYYNTELLFFSDYGIGADQYNQFNDKNKLRGFGVGVRFNINKYGGADMCYGLNPYNGVKQFHFIANFNKF